MSRFFTRFQAPTLQNTGSTARDHLASERTFLAWLRTGLGFIALGIGVERFNRLDGQTGSRQPQQSTHQSVSTSLQSLGSGGGQGHAPVIGGAVAASQLARSPTQQKLKDEEELLVAALLGTGTASIVYAAGRYFSNFRLLQMGLFKPSSIGAGLLAISLSGLAGGAWMSTGRDMHSHPGGN